MKRLTITILMIIGVATSAFANDKKVKSEILSAFQAKFARATEITWTTGHNYYKAAFNYKGMWLSAYYNESAQLIGTMRNISSGQLPLYLQNNIKNRYANYWITDLFEVSNNDGFAYYITVQDAGNTVTLVSTNGDEWKTVINIKNDQ